MNNNLNISFSFWICIRLFLNMQWLSYHLSIKHLDIIIFNILYIYFICILVLLHMLCFNLYFSLIDFYTHLLLLSFSTVLDSGIWNLGPFWTYLCYWSIYVIEVFVTKKEFEPLAFICIDDWFGFHNFNFIFSFYSFCFSFNL